MCGWVQYHTWHIFVVSCHHMLFRCTRLSLAEVNKLITYIEEHAATLQQQTKQAVSRMEVSLQVWVGAGRVRGSGMRLNGNG